MEHSLKNIQAIARIAHKVMYEDQNTDKAFQACFKEDKSLSASDSGFIVKEVHYLIRNWRLLTEIRSGIKSERYTDMESLLAIGWVLEHKTIPDIPAFKHVKKKAILEVYQTLTKSGAVLNSVPDWLDEVGYAELGDAWPAILQSLNQYRELVVRTNSLKCTRDSLRKALQAQGIQTNTHTRANQALIFSLQRNVFKLPEFRMGWFEMQDVSSQLTGQFVNPLPGMRIIDGCAGNGGKTLQLASLMQNKGKIIALDIFPTKLDTLRCRAKRAGISIIETRAIDSTKVIKRLHNNADIVLLDVPCSGLGVLKRNPEIKWRLQPADLENLRKTQEDILNRYSLMAKPGGKVVYSTCSILPSENSLQIQKFIQNHGDSFELVSEQFISPEEGFDGFYMAMLLRKA